MPAANVIQLRQLLSEKFPGLRTHFTEKPPADRWPTGIVKVDNVLQGGLPRSALSEIVTEEKSSGGAALMHALLAQAAKENQVIGFIDGMDSLEVTAMDESTLAHLLWVRCHSAEMAMKAADILLRDGNFSLVVIDLTTSLSAQLRKIPATAWYRLQRLVEEATTVCAILTPWAMVNPATARVTLQARLSLAALEQDREQLLESLTVELFGAGQDLALPQQSIA